jgi:hypothetical protein
MIWGRREERRGMRKKGEEKRARKERRGEERERGKKKRGVVCTIKLCTVVCPIDYTLYSILYVRLV